MVIPLIFIPLSIRIASITYTSEKPSKPTINHFKPNIRVHTNTAMWFPMCSMCLCGKLLNHTDT